MFRVTSLIAASAALASASPLLPRQSNDTTSFNWTSITPSTQLEYHDCYTGFSCARLQVPLDWNQPNNTDASNIATIALLRIPASVPSSDSSFGGTVLLNQGGPGLPGTTFAQGFGQQLQATLDGDKHYEIIGFDPRGVFRSTPNLDCFQGEELLRTADNLVTAGLGGFGSSEVVTTRHWSKQVGKNAVCEEVLKGVLPYVSSASVARDMVEIIDRVDELQRNTNAARVGVSGPPRLQYMGFSYGTALGMTFASMFPGRVGRVLIDGIVDMDDYINGTWKRNVNDANKAVLNFYDDCFKAGSSACPLRLPNDTSPLDMKSRVDQFMASVDELPVSVFSSGTVLPLNAASFQQPFHNAMTTYVASGATFATTLAQVLAGNLSAVFPAPDDSSTPQTEVYTFGPDSTQAIAAMDAVPEAASRDAAFWINHAAELKAQSPTTGAYWGTTPLGTVGRTIHPDYVYRGPFTSPEANSNVTDGAPAAPILFLTSSIDPSTPIANAHKMSAQYPGSTVVEQTSIGHCALFSGTSDCTTQIVRAFFDKGELPEAGSVCQADCVNPWDECATAGAAKLKRV